MTARPAPVTAPRSVTAPPAAAAGRQTLIFLVHTREAVVALAP
jgi:hypothetical protein